MRKKTIYLGRLSATLILVLVFKLTAFCQTSLEIAERETNTCIESYVNNNGGDWGSILAYFEEYLSDHSFRKKDETLAQAYWNFLDYRSTQPIRRIPDLQDRNQLKQMLSQAGILKGDNTIGYPFLSCYADTYKNHQKNLKNEERFKEVAEMSEVLTNIPDIAPTLFLGALKTTLKPEDLSEDLYKKTVFLLAFCDVIYLEELIKDEVSADNVIVNRAKEPLNYQDDDVVIIVPIDSVSKREEEIVELVEINDPVYVIVETMPVFDDSSEPDENLLRYIKTRIKSDKPKGTGTVFINFIINKDGKISDVKVLRGVNTKLDALAKMYVEEMSPWIPGEQRGEKVTVVYNLPIRF